MPQPREKVAQMQQRMPAVDFLAPSRASPTPSQGTGSASSAGAQPKYPHDGGPIMSSTGIQQGENWHAKRNDLSASGADVQFLSCPFCPWGRLEAYMSS